MAISEAARSDLYNVLSRVIGPDPAETLMSAVPLHDLDEVATKGDLAESREATRADIAELRTELKTEIAELRTEVRTGLAEVRTEMAGFHTELKTDIAHLRAEFKTDLAYEVGGLRKTMGTWMLTLTTANIGALVTVAFLT